MNNKKQRKYPVRDKMLVEKTVVYTPRELPTALFRIPLGMHRSVEILPQSNVTCGAAAVFRVICGNPHVMHKEMSFLQRYNSAGIKKEQ
jgi:hypothetical protein